MYDTFFYLGLLKADRTSYISQLPIPIVEKIYNYLRSSIYTNYIIWDIEKNKNVFTCKNDPKLNEFFDFINSETTDIMRCSMCFKRFLGYCVKDNYVLYRHQIIHLMSNKHLLFEVLNEETHYKLKIQHIYECYNSR